MRAWVHLDADGALALAERIDAGEVPPGPLRGLPVGIKDIIHVAGMPTGYGVDREPDHPLRDAACVARLRAAGAIVLGKTVTTELAYATPGPTANPYDVRRTPGGSSSGSAAAVADRMVPLAVGSQTASSVIRPAAYCGTVGFKPSFGMISRAGVLAFAESLDTLGVLARSVEDAAAAVAVMAGRPRLADVVAPARPPRLAVWETSEAASADSLDTLAAVADLARANGASVTFDPVPYDSALGTVHRTIMAFEATRALSAEPRGPLSEELGALLDEGDRITPEAYDVAICAAAAARERLAGVLADFDAVVTPSAGGSARGLDSTGSPSFNRVWTLLHGPCVHLPVRLEDGAPLGVQLVGSAGTDEAVLAAACWLQARLSPLPPPPQ